MYVAIPVADEPSNPSLPYAIASIRRHTNYNIVTIGKDYGLADDHIELEQAPGRRNQFANTDAAMRLACEHYDQFIWSNDDIYWTRPAEPIRWALGDLREPHHSGLHTRRKRNTARHLETHGLPTWDYESHTPLLVDAVPMLEALDIIETHGALDKRSLYGNLTGQPDIIAPDVKVRHGRWSVPDTPWLSSTDRTLEALKQHLPTP